MNRNHHNTSNQVKSVNVNRLGSFLDGWADLVEGMGEKVEDVRDHVYKLLLDRDMPDIEVENVRGHVSLISAGSDKREYTISTTSPGATTTMYVGEHGKDLYISWHTYIRYVLNRKRLAVMLVIAAAFGLLSGCGVFIPGMGAASSDLVREFNIFGPIQVLLLTGSCFIGIMFFAFMLEVFVLIMVGLFIKRDPLAFFFIEPNVFDADDIAAMSLAAHKSILRALDQVGIKVAQLRKKQIFQGKRGESV